MMARPALSVLVWLLLLQLLQQPQEADLRGAAHRRTLSAVSELANETDTQVAAPAPAPAANQAANPASVGSTASPSAGGSSQGGPAEQVPPYMQHMTVVLVCLHLSVFVTGLVGNSLVCLSVLRNKSLQTVTNYYIVNLALADFLVILVCLPPTVYWDLTLTWNFGLILCKLVLYLQSISVSVSVLTLTCISIDRWYAICRPLEFSSTKYRAKITICLIWLLSMLIASPDAIFLTTKPLYEEDDYVYTDCTYSWPEWNTKIYQLCIVTLLFVGPFVLMSISYSHIVNVLWRNEMSAIQSEEAAAAGSGCGSGSGSASACLADYGNMPSTSTSRALALALAAPPAGTSRSPKRIGPARAKAGSLDTETLTESATEPSASAAAAAAAEAQLGVDRCDCSGRPSDEPPGRRANNGQASGLTGAKILESGGLESGSLLDVAPGVWAQDERRPTILGGGSRSWRQPRAGFARSASCQIVPAAGAGQESRPGNETGECRRMPAHDLPAAQPDWPALRSRGPRAEQPERLIQNGEDTKSSCKRLTRPASSAGRDASAGANFDDNAAAKGEPIVGPECQDSAQPRPSARRPNVSGRTRRGRDEPLKGEQPARCCCGLLAAGLARRDDLGESFISLEAHNCPPGQQAAPVKSASIVDDGTTSKKYRRNLANYAARRDKYRLASGSSPKQAKAVRLMTTPSASRLELDASPGKASGQQGNSNDNGELAGRGHQAQNNLHSPGQPLPQPQPQQQQQQQPAPPNYLSSSSSNNARFYKLIESRKKAAKMLIVIVIMFGLCYLPIHFLNTLRYTIGLPQNDITTIASLVSHWLCYFNSAINPLIYNLMSGKFRKEFADLFFCRCFRRHG